MATVVQRTYAPQIAPAVVGMIANEAGDAVGTRECETAAGIGFGLAVSQGTKEGGAVLGGSAFIGVSVRDVTLDRISVDPAYAGATLPVDTYPQYQSMAVLSRGDIWVKCMGGGATGTKAGDGLFFDATTGEFTNTASGKAANGSVTFTAQPAVNDTIVINGTTWTFVASGATAAQINIGATLGDTVAAAAAKLGASTDANTTVFQFAAYPPSPGGSGQGSGANTLMYAAETVGTAGNALVITLGGTLASTATVQAMSGGSAAATAVVGGYWKSNVISGQIGKISLGIQR